MNTVWKVLTRKKILDPVSAEQSELGRVLNTLDLTALGVGSTLGVGVYVLAGQIAKDTAGPAVVLSFLIATVASVFAGLCYAEFGSRAPRAGSAYIYSYVCVGEAVAFVIGWNLILEYVIGSASVARALSLYLDTLVNNTLKDTFIDIAPIGNVDFMSPYFDFMAFGVSLLLAIALAFGLKESKWVNNIFTLVNILVVIFVVIAGSVKADGNNWHIDPHNAEDVTNTTVVGNGGFFPFGVEGMIKGAAMCFYGFVGFDCIATTGEEVKNPKKAIPVAIVLSLFIIFLAYFGTSTVVTLMVPYYNEDRNAPLPHAFEMVGLDWAKWVVAIGGLFGLSASLFGAMFPLPRIIYAMASDSIIFRFLGRVSSKFKTPVVGTLFAGLLTGLMAALFDLSQLIKMMSIGTLLAYTIVAASVLLLRYEVDKDVVYEPLLGSLLDSEDSETYTEDDGPFAGGESSGHETTNSTAWLQIFNFKRQELPSELSERIVKIQVCLYCILCVFLGLCAMYLSEPIGKGEIWAIVITAVVVAAAILVIMSITTQPKSRKELTFKVPLVPLIPALSILINIYLMLMLDKNTWIRFGVWMIIGLPIYYFSVKTHSDARNESICSRDTTTTITNNGKLNGFANHSFEADIVTEPRKKQAPPPPPAINVEETIAQLDQLLEIEEANINDRKFSVDDLSTASVLREENVQADVHCSDAPPLLQSSDVARSESPLPVVSPVAVIDEHQSEVTEENCEPLTEDILVEYDTIIEDKPFTKETVSEHDEPVKEESQPEEVHPINDETDSRITEAPLMVPETDSRITETPPIPPPPPPPMKLEFESPTPSRPLFEIDEFLNVKLRPVQRKKPETPSVLHVPPANENIKFGTPEYKEFREQLDQKLQQGSYVPVPVIPDPKKKPVTLSTGVPVNKENVIEDSIDRNNAKDMLAEFLQRTNSLPYSNARRVVVDDRAAKIEEEKPESIFRSVRLKKEDSFKNGDVKDKAVEEIKEPVISHEIQDRLQHKQNMDNIFRSIRLRKVDSFKINESQ